eukprot:594625-Prorocentrum_minimum.AAC.1
MVTGTSEPRAAAEALLLAEGSLVRWVVLKMGEKGCYILTSDQEWVHHPAMDVTLEDTVGCVARTVTHNAHSCW